MHSSYFRAKRQKFPVFWNKIAEIPLIVGQKGRNSLYVKAKNTNSPYFGAKLKIPLILGQNSRNFTYFGAKLQKFHLFWGKIAEISLISG